MKRREFISLLGGATAWPFAARAQPERVRRIGVLHVLGESDFEARSWVNALKQGLAEFGWNDGLNVRIEVRAGGGEVNQMQKFARELVDLHPDVIVAMATPSAHAILREAGPQHHGLHHFRANNRRQMGASPQGDCAQHNTRRGHL